MTSKSFHLHKKTKSHFHWHHMKIELIKKAALRHITKFETSGTITNTYRLTSTYCLEIPLTTNDCEVLHLN